MWLVIVLLIAVTLLLLVSPVTAEIKYDCVYREDQGESGTAGSSHPNRGVRISFFWGLLNIYLKAPTFGRKPQRAINPVLNIRTKLFKKHGPTLAREESKTGPDFALKLIRRAQIIYRAVAPVQNFILSRILVRRFIWRTVIGLPEAAQTGVATGMLWVLKGNTAAFLYQKLSRRSSRPELEIVPVFNRQLLHVYFNCIFTMRTGHIIYTGLLAGWYFLKNKTKPGG